MNRMLHIEGSEGRPDSQRENLALSSYIRIL